MTPTIIYSVTVRCACGQVLKAATDSRGHLDGLIDLFYKRHRGEGHGPATAEQARRARVGGEREARRHP